MIDLLAIVGLYALIAGQYTLLIKNNREVTRLKAETRLCPYHQTLRDFNGN
jgi:hypothetical protein